MNKYKRLNWTCVKQKANASQDILASEHALTHRMCCNVETIEKYIVGNFANISLATMTEIKNIISLFTVLWQSAWRNH